MASLDATKTSLIPDHEFLALKGGGWATVQQVGKTIRYETFAAEGESQGETSTLVTADGNLEHINFHGAARNAQGDTYVLFTARDKDTGVVELYSQVFDRHLESYDKPLLLTEYGDTPRSDEYSQVNALGDGRFIASWDPVVREDNMTLHYPYASIQDADGDVLTRWSLSGYATSEAGDMDVAAVGKDKFVHVNQEDGNVYLSLAKLSNTKNPDGTYDLGSVSSGRAESSIFQHLSQRNVSVCGIADGRFVVTYEYFDKGYDISTLYQRIFNGNAEAIDLGLLQRSTDELVSNAYNRHQRDADTAGLADGGWATVWREGTDDSNIHDIYLKAYSAEGYGQTLDIKINTASGNCKAPEVTALSNGNALVTWTQHGQLQQQVIDLSGNAIYGKDEFTASGDSISGTGGRDRIFGLEGYDTILGQAGNDLIDGGGGKDTMKGGLGHDTYWVDRLDDTIVELKHNGHDTVKTLVSFSLEKYPNVENVTLLGVLDLDAQGNDLDSHLIGNSGNNILVGLDGDDILEGRRGFDTLTGGEGADIFVFRQNNDRDTVTDFEPGKDRIDLSSFSDVHGVDDLDMSQNHHGDVVIDLGDGDSIVLQGIDRLTDKQFLFAA
jgi:Ca2+-binding RTX toxin-like protein